MNAVLFICARTNALQQGVQHARLMSQSASHSLLSCPSHAPFLSISTIILVNSNAPSLLPHIMSHQQLELFSICRPLFCHTGTANPDWMSLSVHLSVLFVFVFFYIWLQKSLCWHTHTKISWQVLQVQMMFTFLGNGNRSRTPVTPNHQWEIEWIWEAKCSLTDGKMMEKEAVIE